MKKDGHYTPVLIDWETKGNLIRLYFGDREKAWGDDWNDAPYEHNAGTVYQEFVNYAIDIVIDFEWDIIEPDYGTNNSPYTKEKLLKGSERLPILIFTKESWRYRSYDEVRNTEPEISLRAGMTFDEVMNPEKHAGAIVSSHLGFFNTVELKEEKNV